MTKMLLNFLVLFSSFVIGFDPRVELVPEVHIESEYKKILKETIFSHFSALREALTAGEP